MIVCIYEILWSKLLHESCYSYQTDTREDRQSVQGHSALSLCIYAGLCDCGGFIPPRFSSASLSAFVLFCGNSRYLLQWTSESHCCKQTVLTQGKWHQPRFTPSHCWAFMLPFKCRRMNQHCVKGHRKTHRARSL